MRARLSRMFATAVFAFALPYGCFAGWSQRVNVDPDAHASIEVSSCFEAIPSTGYVPVNVTIVNDQVSDGTWRVSSSESPYSGRSGVTYSFSAEFPVAARTSRKFSILVPIARNQGWYLETALRVTGPGCAGRPIHLPTGRNSGLAQTGFTAMSESLAVPIWSQLEADFKSDNMELRGSKFDPSQLPEDWRAYLGIATLWMTNGEWETLPGAQRSAIEEWVALGGHLLLCGTEDASVEPRGFGKKEYVPLRDGKLIVWAAEAGIKAARTPLDFDQYRSWSAVKLIGQRRFNVPLLGGFMVLFALVIGPGNMILVRKKRHRLFWTVPAISLGSSLLLLVLIVVTDGFGGSGARYQMVQIDPVARQAIVKQEQIAKTGVLLSKTFENREPLALFSVPLKERRIITEKSGDRYSDWFRSRALQAHVAMAIRPTRAEVQVLNPEEAAQGSAPVVLSTVSATLEPFWYRDANGVMWTARSVPTGVKTPLVQTNSLPVVPKGFGSHLAADYSAILGQKQIFVAGAKASAESSIETLPSIKWTTQEAVYTGAVTLKK